MTLTDFLKRMHDDFRARLARMDRIAQEGGPGESVKLAHELAPLIRILQAHEWVEEEVLHAALREYAPAADPNAPAANKAGHRALHRKIEEVEAALARPGESLNLLLAAKSFSALLREHMREEEDGILAAAEKHIPPDASEELGARVREALKKTALPAGALPDEP